MQGPNNELQSAKGQAQDSMFQIHEVGIEY